jgi:RimJ/RimL family protein N-acetyltransferase
MILPMTTAYATQISGWAYENEYAVYSFAQTDDTMSELMNGEYYAYLDTHDALAGYFCFGQSAQIPTIEKDAYPPDALDMGLGMRPDLCGQGLGYAFVKSGLAFAIKTFAPQQLRLSVTVFNLRAIRMYGKVGFRYNASITHRRSRKLFYMMIYTC